MYVPATVSLPMLVVTVAEPEPLMLVLLSMTAGPVGEAVMVRSTILSKPYFGTTVIVAVPGSSAVIVSEVTLVAIVKSGVSGAATVTTTLVVWIKDPLVPAIVTM